MSDSEGAAAPPPEQSTTAEAETKQENPKPEKPSSISTFSIWPPTQRTRDAVVNRLVETLTTPSPLSNRYGTMAYDEASAAARVIEEDAFAAAGGSAATEEDGIRILQVYSKEISKRMLDTVKDRTTSASAASAASAVPKDSSEPEPENSAVDAADAEPSEDVMTESS